MESGKPSPSLSLSVFLLIFFLSNVCVSMGQTNSNDRKTYIVHVAKPMTAAFASSADRENWHRSFLATTIASSKGPQMVYSYGNAISGFAAQLTEEEVKDMKQKEGFVQAYPDRLMRLQTTHTPSFLGLRLEQGPWKRSNLGRGVIIGVLDTGVIPTHPSFSSYGMPSPPAKWKGRCEFNASSCNNKIIGARTFLSGASAIKGAAAAVPPLDDDGHGTHTASTAAGAFVEGANVLGQAMGMAAGMAPLAHLAIYKVCSIEDCAASDILAGMDAAVDEGVDVLSISIGDFFDTLFEDEMATGGFGAMEKGVFVSCSAANSGPNGSSLANEAPWILTVAASTMDRSIRATVNLGNGIELDGQTVFQPKDFDAAKQLPLVYAGASSNQDARLCGNGSFDGVDIRGKIVLCERGVVARIEKGAFVQGAGGAGMILMNDEPNAFSTLADAHVLPASHVSFADGNKIKNYINASAYPTATFVFKGTILGTSPAPAITSFSSRGPTRSTPGILKPDITGPGADVLAAWPFPVGPNSTNPTAFTFNIISGTSMSAPHLAGIAALIKSAHPYWSPAAIKSALMTTADAFDHSGKPILDERHMPADFFATGAGHVDPVRATDPGLVYDISAEDYIPFLCGLNYTSAQVGLITRRATDCSKVKSIAQKDLNYPSILVSLGPASGYVTVERTVKNVGEANATYWAKVDAPDGVVVTVEPKTLWFSRINEEKSFTVRFIGIGAGVPTSQGQFTWVSTKHWVRSPIMVTFNK